VVQTRTESLGSALLSGAQSDRGNRSGPAPCDRWRKYRPRHNPDSPLNVLPRQSLTDLLPLLPSALAADSGQLIFRIRRYSVKMPCPCSNGCAGRNPGHAHSRADDQTQLAFSSECSARGYQFSFLVLGTAVRSGTAAPSPAQGPSAQVAKLLDGGRANGCSFVTAHRRSGLLTVGSSEHTAELSFVPTGDWLVGGDQRRESPMTRLTSKLLSFPVFSVITTITICPCLLNLTLWDHGPLAWLLRPL